MKNTLKTVRGVFWKEGKKMVALEEVRKWNKYLILTNPEEKKAVIDIENDSEKVRFIYQKVIEVGDYLIAEETENCKTVFHKTAGRIAIVRSFVRIYDYCLFAKTEGNKDCIIMNGAVQEGKIQETVKNWPGDILGFIIETENGLYKIKRDGTKTFITKKKSINMTQLTGSGNIYVCIQVDENIMEMTVFEGGTKRPEEKRYKDITISGYPIGNYWILGLFEDYLCVQDKSTGVFHVYDGKGGHINSKTAVENVEIHGEDICFVRKQTPYVEIYDKKTFKLLLIDNALYCNRLSEKMSGTEIPLWILDYGKTNKYLVSSKDKKKIKGAAEGLDYFKGYVFDCIERARYYVNRKEKIWELNPNWAGGEFEKIREQLREKLEK